MRSTILKEKYQRLAQLDETTETVRVGAGRFDRDVEMAGHSVRLLRLTPSPKEK